MAVSSDKIRILVTVPRDEKEKLEEAAKREIDQLAIMFIL